MSIFYFFLLAAAVILLDQLTKNWIDLKLNPGESWPIIDNVFHLTYVLNPGAAFGLLAYRTHIFIVVSLIMVVLILLAAHFFSPRYYFIRLALALQLGGAVGNLIDRVRTGYVIDFLDFRIWPVFNVADIAIVAGVFLLIANLGHYMLCSED